MKPEVGMGATEQLHSDRHAYTIIEVISDKKILVQQDIATRTDKNGYYTESQQYEYSPGHSNPQRMITLRKDGCWRPIGQDKGSQFIIGTRNEYRDPHF